MKASTTILAAGLAGNAVAFPQLVVEKRQDAAHAWQGPGAGDERTACPGLNTLANHGYINRNGRGITAQQVQDGFQQAFGFDPAVTLAGATNAVNLQGNGQTFDLTTLNQPHIIEHDASLSRLDAEMAWDQNANNFAFNDTVFCETLNWYGPITHISAASANTARLGRITQAQADDAPGWFKENDGGSLAEHGFTLSAFNDPAVGGSAANPQARLDWVEYWFRNERLPTELGWQARTIPDADFNSIVNAVSGAATTVPAPRGTTCGSPVTTPSTSATPTPSGAPYGPTYTSKTLQTSAPYPKSNGTTPIGKPSPSPSSKPTSTPSGTVPSQPAQVTSSAEAKATQLAGPSPAFPNAYTQILSKQQWDQFKGIISTYVEKVMVIIYALCDLNGVGQMPLPGAGPAMPGTAAQGGAPWYTSSSPAAADTCACK